MTTSENKNEQVWWMGFDSMSGRMLAGDPAEMRKRHGVVPPRTTIMIRNRPQIEYWRGERLFVHQPIATKFLIHDIRVGMNSSIPCVGPIPTDAFATRMDRLAEIDHAFDRDGVFQIEVHRTGAEILGSVWDLPRATVATDVIIVVENISEEPARFLAGFLGKGPRHGF